MVGLCILVGEDWIRLPNGIGDGISFAQAAAKETSGKEKRLACAHDAGVVRRENGRKRPNAFAAAQVRRRCGRWALGVQAGESDASGRATASEGVGETLWVA